MRQTKSDLMDLIMDHPNVKGEGPYLVVMMCLSAGLILERHPTLSAATAAGISYTGPKWLFEVGAELDYSDANMGAGFFDVPDELLDA